MSPILAGQLLDINAQCSTEEREIFDFPEYGSTLDAGQMTRLRAIAADIIRSHETHAPIAGISVIGHADRALRVPEKERAAKEMSVSVDRAKNAETQLLDMIQSMPSGGPVRAMVHTKATGVGATKLVIPFPKNEQEMKRNRRVVFSMARCIQNPIIHPRIDLPPNPPGDPKDNPNTVFAGNRFMMRILDGFSAGEVGGIFSYHMEIVDVDNKRSAEYTYSGIIGTIGVPPFSECGTSDFSKVFAATKPVQVDQLSGEASHTSGSIGLASGMRFTFESCSEVTTGINDVPITIFAGPSKSLGVEAGVSGSIGVIRGTVKIFKE